ncbi:hypothetical protein, partial [Mycolicibacterium confluentis]
PAASTESGSHQPDSRNGWTQKRGLANGANAPHALVARQVRRQADKGRAIIVDDRDGETIKISSRRVTPGNLGFALIRIGDFETERTLLDPLAKSVMQFLRLMLPDELVTSVSIRTQGELREWWMKNSAAQTHCVLIGHGDPAGIKFLDRDSLVTGLELGKALTDAAPDKSAKSFLSLSCLTGRAAFGNGFSSTGICKEFIGPYHSVHGAAASQYTQTLLAHHLLDGVELLPSHRRANRSTSKNSTFRFYRSGGSLLDTYGKVT